MKIAAGAFALILLALANFPQRALADSFVINDTSGTAILMHTGFGETVTTTQSGPDSFIWLITPVAGAQVPIPPFAALILGTDGTTVVGQLTVEARGNGTLTGYNISFTGCDPAAQPQPPPCPAGFSTTAPPLVESGTLSTTNPLAIPSISGDIITVESAPLTQVPEPATAVLLGTGLLGLVGAIRRKLPVRPRAAHS